MADFAHQAPVDNPDLTELFVDVRRALCGVRAGLPCSQESADEYNPVLFETMKNCVFWDVTPCGSCKNRRFGGT
jgi:hypothetical protein